MGLIFVPYYIHFLGMDAYGLIGLYTLMQAWLSLLDMGMTPTLSREMARFSAGAHNPQSIHNLLRTLEIVVFSFALLIGAGIWASSDFLATDWLKSEKLPSTIVSQAISIMAFVVALRFSEGIYRGSLMGLQKQIWYNSVNAFLATLRGAGVLIILKWVSPTIEAFFIWQAIISLFSILIYSIGVHYFLPKPTSTPRFSRESIADIWKFAGGMMGITFLALLLTQVDKVLLSKLLPLDEYGYYTLAASVAAFSYMVIGPITQAVYPRMVQLVTLKDNNGLISTYHSGAQLITVLIAPVVLMLCFFSEGAIYAWSGNPVLAKKSGELLSILIIGNFLNGLMYMPYQCQLAHGWTSLTLKVNIVAVTLLMPAILIAVPKFGALAAVWIWVIINSGYFLITISLMHRKLLITEKWRWYFFDVLLPTSGALLVAFISYFFKPALSDSRLNWLFFLSITGFFALISTIALSSIIRGHILKFIKRLKEYLNF